MRGRKPKPTALKVIEGNRGKRPLNQSEPKPGKGDKPPRCPIHLSKAAKSEWKRLARHLWELGLLTPADRAVFACYCQAWATWKAAEEAVKKEGFTITTTNGNVVQNPLVGVANKAQERLKAFAAELGLSPSARTRIHVPPKADKTLDELLK